MNAPAKTYFAELLDCSNSEHFTARVGNYNYRADYNLFRIERLEHGVWVKLDLSEIVSKPWIRTNLERLTKTIQRRKVAEILQKTNYVDAKTYRRRQQRQMGY